MVLLAVPALAVWLVWLASGDPITAEVVPGSVTGDDGPLEATVRFTDDTGTRRTARLELSDEHVTSGTVPIMTDGRWGGADTVWVATGPPLFAMIAAAVLSFLLVLVVLGTVRGYGYVRGTGRSGEMTTDEVQESRGFYWRH